MEKINELADKLSRGLDFCENNFTKENTNTKKLKSFLIEFAESIISEARKPQQEVKHEVS